MKPVAPVSASSMQRLSCYLMVGLDSEVREDSSQVVSAHPIEGSRNVSRSSAVTMGITLKGRAAPTARLPSPRTICRPLRLRSCACLLRRLDARPRSAVKESRKLMRRHGRALGSALNDYTIRLIASYFVDVTTIQFDCIVRSNFPRLGERSPARPCAGRSCRNC